MTARNVQIVLAMSCLLLGCSGEGDDVPEAQAGAGAAAGTNAGTSGVAGAAGVDATQGAAGQAGDQSSGFEDDGGTLPITDDASLGPDASSSGFPPVTSVSEKGPFATKNANGENEGPNCTIHRPATLGENGLRHPVIIWGMGTGGFNLYQPAFDLWASHGFIVAGGLLGNGQGSGEEMLGCLEYVCEHYAPNVDCRAGASGHSQGGGGAIMAGRDPRVITTAPVQPYIQQGFGGFDQASINKQVGPMLLLSGTLDNIAGPAMHQQPVFDDVNQPVFWANRVGADHVTVGTDGLVSYREAILAWFRLQLMGDESFRGMFYGKSCTLCMDSKWMVQRAGLD